MFNFVKYPIIIAVCALTFSCVNTNKASAIECSSDRVVTIFARGSGESLGFKTYEKWYKGINKSVTNTETYELGSQKISGYQYPAVDVNSWGNRIGAFITAGNSAVYGRSVQQGVNEVKAYMNQTDKSCDKVRYVLAGYSQGAQVIGESLAKISESQRSRVLFTALFGDPKLYLPEGFGLDAPACHHKNLSPWRRVMGDCNNDHGSLGARKPYLPKDQEHNTGSWCYRHDAICGGSEFLWDVSTHGDYKNDGKGIDQAVIEITKIIQDYRDTNSGTYTPPVGGGDAPIVRVPLRPETWDFVKGDSDKTKNMLDVAIVLDTTGSMGGQINLAKSMSLEIAQKIADKNGRIALIDYKDFGDEYTAKIRQGLTSNVEEFSSALSPVYSGGGGDGPEATLHALKLTLNGLDWRYGAQKSAIVITDNIYHDPDNVDGTTTADVIKRSLEIDPVNIYVVGQVDLEEYYQRLIEGTAGEFVADDGYGDIVDALMKAVDKIVNRPTVVLPTDQYSGLTGDTFNFDASLSHVDEANIVGYDWDYNGDGLYDQTTDSPIADHAYLADFDGLMQVRARADNGTVGSASARVIVASQIANLKPKPPINVSVKQDSDTQATLTWQADGEDPTSWGIALNGVPLGLADGKQHSLVIGELDRSIDNIFGVMAVTEEGRYSEMAEAMLPKVTTTTTKTEQKSPSSDISDKQTNKEPKYTLDGDAHSALTDKSTNVMSQDDSELGILGQSKSDAKSTKSDKQNIGVFLLVTLAIISLVSLVGYMIYRRTHKKA